MTISPDTAGAVGAGDLSVVLEEVLDAAITLAGADFGNIQLLDAEGRLKIAVQRGFPEWWIDYWNEESRSASCGMALAMNKRVVVEDVEKNRIFVGTPGLDVQLRAGVRAVQSTPMRARSGEIVGVISTHHREPHRPEPGDLRVIDFLSTHAATIVSAVLSRTGEHGRSGEVTAAAHEATGTGVFEFDVKGNVTAWSKEQAEIYGRDPADRATTLEGLSEFAVHPRDVEVIREALRRTRGENGAYEIEHRVVRPDGSERWVHHLAHPKLDEQGRLQGYAITTTDVTERNRARPLSEAYVRDLAETTTGFPFRCLPDATRTMTFMGPEFELLTGHRSTDFLAGSGRSWWSIVHPDDVARVERVVREAVEARRAWQVEYRIVAAGGRVIEAEELGRAHEGVDGRPDSLVAVVFEVTAKKRDRARPERLPG
ncbi:MAG: PAS domain-containing protein [Alphaproteobacteria bacterium]